MNTKSSFGTELAILLSINEWNNFVSKTSDLDVKIDFNQLLEHSEGYSEKNKERIVKFYLANVIGSRIQLDEVLVSLIIS